MDILNILSADYDGLRSQSIELLLSAGTEEKSAWDEKFKSFVRSFEISAKAESAVLGYTATENRKLEDAILSLIERNTILEDLSLAYRLTAPDSIRLAKARVYLDLVTERLNWAEQEIFVLLFDTCSDDERDGLGRSYQRYKSIAQGPGPTVASKESTRAVI